MSQDYHRSWHSDSLEQRLALGRDAERDVKELQGEQQTLSPAQSAEAGDVWLTPFLENEDDMTRLDKLETL